MIQVKCIQKFRNKNNQIYGYRIQDQQGHIKDMFPEHLKQAIKSNQITVINLKLTSDDRLIDTTPTQQPSITSEEQKIKSVIDKARIPGILTEIPTACNHKCYLISKSSEQHIIYIPDDVTNLNTHIVYLEFTKHIQSLQGTLKVVGGKNLQDVQYMFCECEAQFIDFSNFNTSKVTNMFGMFYRCQAQSLDLSNFNTSNITDMGTMFMECQAKSLDLSNFNTSKVTDMYSMFSECQAKSLDLSNFNTSNVTRMICMFSGCKAQSIDLSSFNTSNATSMRCMFSECQAKSLDLSNFNTSKVTDMYSMFSECQAKSLDLSNFNTSNVTDMSKMFKGCQAQSLDISSFDTSNVTDMSEMFKGCKAQIKATDPKIFKRIPRR